MSSSKLGDDFERPTMNHSAEAAASGDAIRGARRIIPPSVFQAVADSNR
jgi:hypothetical protein